MKQLMKNRVILCIFVLLAFGFMAVGCQGTTSGPIEAEPGVKTIQNFLATSLEPVGETLYVWGGGWNEEDDGAGRGATTIGVLPEWSEFYAQNDADYDYETTRYQIDNGLDCSGFVGWTVYNLLNTESGDESKGEVYSSKKGAQTFAQKGYGTYTPMGQITEFLPGDIISLEEDGHTFISLGQCEDGSIVVVHASPPGVMISGTLGPNGEQTQATKLSHTYMEKYYPDYYERYSDQLDRNYDAYINKSAKMSWSEDFVSDPEGIRNKTPEEVLQILFNEN